MVCDRNDWSKSRTHSTNQNTMYENWVSTAILYAFNKSIESYKVCDQCRFGLKRPDHLVTRNGQSWIVFDSKNYSSPLNKKEIDKLVRDKQLTGCAHAVIVLPDKNVLSRSVQKYCDEHDVHIIEFNPFVLMHEFYKKVDSVAGLSKDKCHFEFYSLKQFKFAFQQRNYK